MKIAGKKLWYFLGTTLVFFAGLMGWGIYSLKLTEEEQSFIFLAEILYGQTKGAQGKQEQLKVMTKWLHDNVRHVQFYPASFDGRRFVSVIKAGVGNCGYQAGNITSFAEMLGMMERRVYHFKRKKEGDLTHTFAEIKVDGKWQVYDPDLMLYQEDSQGHVLGLVEMRQQPEQIKNRIFYEVITQDTVNRVEVTKARYRPPMPFGAQGYLTFARCRGKTGFLAYLVWQRQGLKDLFLALSGALFLIWGIPLIRRR